MLHSVFAAALLARQEAPKFCFPDSMPLESIRDTMDSWNTALAEHYPGKGYYAFSQEDEMARPGYHWLVLFSDQSFCDAFIGSIKNENVPLILFGMMTLQFRN